MEIIKKYKILLILALAVLVGGFFFFARMYTHDIKALENFSASYQKFDTAISNFSVNGTGDLESKVGDALMELDQNSSIRISSLIKNERPVMSTELEVADISKKEFNALKAYKQAILNKNPLADELAKEYKNLTGERKSAYAHFVGFAE